MAELSRYEDDIYVESVSANDDTLTVSKVQKAGANVNYVDAETSVDVTSNGITVRGNNVTGIPFENKLVEIGDFGEVKVSKSPVTYGPKTTAYDTSGYWQTPHAVAELSGHVSLGGLVRVISGQTLVSGDVVAKLPSNFHIEGAGSFLVMSYAGPMRLDIKPTGEITVAAMQSGAQQTTGFVSLEGIRFVGKKETV